MKTENKIPNAKVVATVIGAIIFGWLNHFAQATLGIDLPPDLAIIIGSVLGGVVGYAIPPRKGDGIVEK